MESNFPIRRWLSHRKSRIHDDYRHSQRSESRDSGVAVKDSATSAHSTAESLNVAQMRKEPEDFSTPSFATANDETWLTRTLTTRRRSLAPCKLEKQKSSRRISRLLQRSPSAVPWNSSSKQAGSETETQDMKQNALKTSRNDYRQDDDFGGQLSIIPSRDTFQVRIQPSEPDLNEEDVAVQNMDGFGDLDWASPQFAYLQTLYGKNHQEEFNVTEGATHSRQGSAWRHLLGPVDDAASDDASQYYAPSQSNPNLQKEDVFRIYYQNPQLLTAAKQVSTQTLSQTLPQRAVSVFATRTPQRMSILETLYPKAHSDTQNSHRPLSLQINPLAARNHPLSVTTLPITVQESKKSFAESETILKYGSRTTQSHKESSKPSDLEVTVNLNYAAGANMNTEDYSVLTHEHVTTALHDVTHKRNSWEIYTPDELRYCKPSVGAEASYTDGFRDCSGNNVKRQPVSITFDTTSDRNIALLDAEETIVTEIKPIPPPRSHLRPQIHQPYRALPVSGGVPYNKPARQYPSQPHYSNPSDSESCYSAEEVADDQTLEAVDILGFRTSGHKHEANLSDLSKSSPAALPTSRWSITPSERIREVMWKGEGIFNKMKMKLSPGSEKQKD